MVAKAAADMFPEAAGDPERAGITAPDDNWPGTLAEYFDVLVPVLVKRGRAHSVAIEDAAACVLALGRYCGGRQRYLPSGERLQTAVRDRMIWLEWRGNNRDALADKYELTTRRVEQIVAEQRAIHVRRIQPQLFEEERT